MTRDTYALPANIRADWLHARVDGYRPNARQALVIEAVHQAFDSLRIKRAWSPELLDHVQKTLKPTPQQLAAGGGDDFATDVYGALRHVIACDDHARALESWHMLRPQIGMKLGTMILSHDRQLEDVTIIGFQGAGDTGNGKGLLIRLEGKPPGGSVGQVVRLPASVTSVRMAIERAHAKGLRASGFHGVQAAQSQTAAREELAPAPRRAHRV